MNDNWFCKNCWFYFLMKKAGVLTIKIVKRQPLFVKNPINSCLTGNKYPTYTKLLNA